MRLLLLTVIGLIISSFPFLEASSTRVNNSFLDELPSVSSQVEKNNMTSTGENASDMSLDILTESNEYVVGLKEISLFVKVYSEEPGIIKLILEEKNSTGQIVYKTSQIVNVPDYIFYLHPGSPGNYNITVTAVQDGNSENASIIFSVIGITDTNTARFLFVSFAFFAALLILVCLTKKNDAKEEILRFLFLSGIVASLLCSFIFTEIEFGKNSPIGLVRADQETIGNQTIGNQTTSAPPGEWVFSIGGALKIPAYVIIFGLIGGYLRYLYKTSRLFIDEDLRNERDKVKKYLVEQGLTDIDRRLIFFESLKDIALFFLAPILAVVVWFLFSQWEPIADSPSLLAVFSFASGLVTNEIVSTISNFTKTNLTKRTSSS